MTDYAYTPPAEDLWKSVCGAFPDCEDFTVRSISVSDLQVKLCWLDGLADTTLVSEEILRPVHQLLTRTPGLCAQVCFEQLVQGGVWACTASVRDTADELIDDLCHGHCVLVLPGLSQALSLEVRSSNTRSVSQPTVEKTVKGAKEAFVETLRTNTAMVRRKLRTSALRFIPLTIGVRSDTGVSLSYIDGITNPALVTAVQARLARIDIDALLTPGGLESYLTDHPASPFPQLLHTERPDTFATQLLAGRVGILVDGLPVGFLAPAPLPVFMHVEEDRSQHFLIASLLTLLRWASFLITILLPALFVAISLYHQEMIPYKFMLSMIEARQNVPFSVATEMLFMLLAFEALQEAGVRLPDPIGDTVSIIGALIIGQAAVEAQIVSPVSVIVVAISGICGFVQPSTDLTAALRVLRLLLVFAAIALGMFGIMCGMVLIVWLLCSMDSFGVNYTGPLSDRGLLHALYTLIQLPLWRDTQRPPSLHPLDATNQGAKGV